jgi:hypothetical protein
MKLYEMHKKYFLVAYQLDILVFEKLKTNLVADALSVAQSKQPIQLMSIFLWVSERIQKSLSRSFFSNGDMLIEALPQSNINR